MKGTTCERAIDALDGCTRALREALNVVDHMSWLKALVESKARWKRALLKGEEVLFDHGIGGKR